MFETSWQRCVVLCVFALAPIADISAQNGAASHPVVSSERLLRIGRMIDRRIEAGDVPGTVTLVAIDGRVIHFEARGVLDLDGKRPMTKDAVFSLASLTKPVTAAAVLTLVEEGRIRLADPVSRFLPEFKDLRVAESASRRVAASRPITIRDILTHTSGLVAPAQIPTDPAATLAAVIPRFASEPLEFQPGTQWMYSNTVAFDTAARIVELVSGMTSRPVSARADLRSARHEGYGSRAGRGQTSASRDSIRRDAERIAQDPAERSGRLLRRRLGAVQHGG